MKKWISFSWLSRLKSKCRRKPKTMLIVCPECQARRKQGAALLIDRAAHSVLDLQQTAERLSAGDPVKRQMLNRVVQQYGREAGSHVRRSFGTEEGRWSG